MSANHSRISFTSANHRFRAFFFSYPSVYLLSVIIIAYWYEYVKRNVRIDGKFFKSKAIMVLHAPAGGAFGEGVPGTMAAIGGGGYGC